MSQPPGTPSTPIDLAAGGILEKPQDGHPHVAVVHRRRYGRPGEVGDWSLPKGHANPGESLADAALREVQEETGCEARITGPARTTSYFVVDTPKMVLFHPMECLREGTLTDTAEVHSVHWLKPNDAVKVLSYEGERELIRRQYPKYFLQRWPRRVWQALSRAPDRPEQRRRLDAGLDDMRRRIEESAPLRPTSAGDPAWLTLARARLDEARRQRSIGRFHSAWGLAREAGRLRLHALETHEDQRLVQGQRLLAAAQERLQGWRRDAVRTSLSATQGGPAPAVERLVHAQHLLDEEDANQSFRLDLVARRFHALPRVLLASLLVLWCVAWLRTTPALPAVEEEATAATPVSAPAGVLDDGSQLLLVSILGAIGALVSTVFLTRDPGGPAPGFLEPGPELFLRLTLGALIAVLVSMVLQGGVTPLLKNEGPSLLTLVVAAGLADRLLSRTLHRFEQAVRH